MKEKKLRRQIQQNNKSEQISENKSMFATVVFALITLAVILFFQFRISDRAEKLAQDNFYLLAENTADLVRMTDENNSETLESILSNVNLDATSLRCIVDKEGNILYINDTAEMTEDPGNLFDIISMDDKVKKRVSTALKSGAEYFGSAESDGTDKVVVVSPVDKGSRSIVFVINRSYYEYKTAYNWKEARLMIRVLQTMLLLYVLAYLINTYRISRAHRQDTEELESKADTDLLTGLYNKLATERNIKEYMEEHPDTPGILILMDIDDFKKINDTKGHAFGDIVLKTLGRELGGEFRCTDIVGRVGGDEFMVFLKNIDGEELIRKEATKLVMFFDNFTAGDDYIRYSPTASMGLALYPSEGKDFDSLYKAADKALYRSKENGKMQLNFYNEKQPSIHA